MRPLLRSLVRPLAALALMGLFTNCPNAGEDRVLGVQATGVVQGFVYLDRNGNRAPDAVPVDTVLRGVRVRVILRGTTDTGAVATSDTGGVFRLLDIPVGHYVLSVDSASLPGDSVLVTRIDTAAIALGPNDSITVRVAVGFPQVTVAEARALPLGRKVFVLGVALNDRTTFGDTTVHLADASGAIRTTTVRTAGIFRRDSLRMLGTRAARNGQPTLNDVTAFLLAIGAQEPAPDSLGTATASAARGGTADAALVRIANAVVAGTSTVGPNRQLTVSDGSGPLIVQLDSVVGFFGTALAGDTVGARLDATGLLVPIAGSAWMLKPRFVAERVHR